MIGYRNPKDKNSWGLILCTLPINSFFYWKRMGYEVRFNPPEKYKHWESLSDPETFVRLIQMEETYVSPAYKNKTIYEQLYFSSLDKNETEFAEYFLTKI